MKPKKIINDIDYSIIKYINYKAVAHSSYFKHKYYL